MTLDRRAASLGGIAGVSARLRQNGGQRRTACPSGSRKPRIAKDQLAVARVRAYLPAALVVGRISIRPGNAGRMGQSVLPAAALLSERTYTIPGGPISRRVSGDRSLLTVAGGYGKIATIRRIARRTGVNKKGSASSNW